MLYCSASWYFLVLLRLADPIPIEPTERRTEVLFIEEIVQTADLQLQLIASRQARPCLSAVNMTAKKTVNAASLFTATATRITKSRESILEQ